MNTPKVLLVKAEDGDWEGLYVDGRMTFQNHSIDANQVLEALGYRFFEVEASIDEFEANGHLPETQQEFETNWRFR